MSRRTAASHAPRARLAGALIGAAAACASAQTLKSTLVAGGFDGPVSVTSAPGDITRLFVLEQSGRIRIIKNGSTLPASFLDLSGVVSFGDERGLLGMAFPANYASTGYFYVSYTGPAPEGDSIIQRYNVWPNNPDLANPATAALVLRIDRQSSYHNGGWIGFGPDGNLYFSSGDGSQGCTSPSIAQSTQSLLAKTLRINVSTLPYTIPPGNPYAGGGGLPEIWTMGLRNHWRCSFDRATGDLWMADVGASEWEEINVLPATTSLVAAPNYGWDCREGPACATASGCPPNACPAGCTSPSFIPPVHSYAHAGTHCAIIGGYVYRGCAIPALQGSYFFADICSGRVWSLRYNGTTVTELIDRTSQLAPTGSSTAGAVSSFGEDAMGELYFCEIGNGIVYKIVPQTFIGPDCNNNGRRDACDIQIGYSTDNNGNAIPDECDCYANCNGSYSGAQPTLTIADFSCFQAKFATAHPYADCNATGGLTVADFSCFQARFVQGCP